MGRFNYNDEEKQINKVLKHQRELLDSFEPLNEEILEDAISSSETLLSSFGVTYEENDSLYLDENKKNLTIPTWDELCNKVNNDGYGNVELEDLFSAGEIDSNAEEIKRINKDFRNLYKLDKNDIMLSVVAGLVAGMADVLLIGIPHSSFNGGDQPAPLSDYVREKLNELIPPGENETLSISKVPFDAQDNRNTAIRVEGLSSYYHRQVQLGHDPLLGFVFGVFDIMTNHMTTIDATGKIVSQYMSSYEDRVEKNLFEAIAKEFCHLKSDVTTPAGLPVPFMSLFNLCQFGESLTDQHVTISELVRGMYYEGYDFIHFCSMSIPMMICEVITRMGYAFRSLHDGKTVKESLPIINGKKDNVKACKLTTMLFIAHSLTTAINTGKVMFKKDPMAINYPEWMAFIKYSYKKLKQEIIEKPNLAMKYVQGIIDDDLMEIYTRTDMLIDDFSKDYNIVLA